MEPGFVVACGGELRLVPGLWLWSRPLAGELGVKEGSLGDEAFIICPHFAPHLSCLLWHHLWSNSLVSDTLTSHLCCRVPLSILHHVATTLDVPSQALSEPHSMCEDKPGFPVIVLLVALLSR